MSSRCERCGKQPRFGRLVARTGTAGWNRRVKARTSRLFRPNLQTTHVAAGGGTTRRRRLCTSCLKAANRVT
jgi:large subunit ribosomal protein L28